MATTTKAAVAKKAVKAVKAPVKKVAPKVEETTEDEVVTKTRGRKADPERDAALTAELMEFEGLEIEGEFPDVRVKNIAAAAAEVGIDSIRAKQLILKHLAVESDSVVEATPEAVKDARLEGQLGWGAIDAMFGTSRSQSHKLFDEAMGEEDAWRKYHLYGTNGAERIKPEVEKSTSSGTGTGAKRGRKSAEEIAAMPAVFPEPDEVDAAEIRAKFDGKTVQRKLVNKDGDILGADKVTIKLGSLKVSSRNGAKPRSIQVVDDKGATRTIQIDSIYKVGR